MIATTYEKGMVSEECKCITHMTLTSIVVAKEPEGDKKK